MKKLVSILLTFVIAFSFASCSGGVESEEVRAVAKSAQDSLVNFDTEEIDKYIESETLLSIEDMINQNEMYQELAGKIFENLTIKVKKVKVDEEKGTGTAKLKIKNKDLETVASQYTSKMVSEYIKGNVNLNDEAYLKEQLTYLEGQIDDADMGKTTKVTVKVKKNDDGKWVLVFDDEAENAVMGGAASTLKSIAKIA